MTMYHWPDGETYWSLLNLTVKKKKRATIYPSPGAIRTSWRECVSSHHPNNRPVSAVGDEIAFRRIMEAWSVLSNPQLRQQYEQLGEAGWDHRRHAYVEDLLDWRAYLLRDVLQALSEREDELAATGGTVDLEWVEKELKAAGLPDELPGEVLALGSPLDIGDQLSTLITTTDRLSWLALHRITWSWRRKTWSSKGSTTAADVRVLSQTDRNLHPDGPAKAPRAEIRIALGLWLLTGRQQRTDRLRHELLHLQQKGFFDLTARDHTVKTFADEATLTGLRDAEQAAWFLAILNHPTTAARLRAMGQMDGAQQVDLFTHLSAGDAADILDRMPRREPDQPSTLH